MPYRSPTVVVVESSRTERAHHLDVLGILAFIVPLTLFIEATIVGRLFMPDILLATLLPFLLSRRGRRLSAQLPRMFLLLSSLWLLGQVATDLIRDIPFVDYARGWAKIALTIINFCSIFLLLDGRPKRIILFALGLAVGGLIRFYVNPGEYAEFLPWKFGYGMSVTMLLVLGSTVISGKGKFGWLTAIMLITGASGFNIYMGYRSLGGILFLVAAYMVAQTLRNKRDNRHSLVRSRQVMIVMFISGLSAWGILEMYGHAAQSGLLGDEAKQHYDKQAAGVYGLLLGGRSEIFASVPAIIDSPILGHGSWAKNCHYVYLLDDYKQEYGYGETYLGGDCLIPSHSHLFGSWVEAGIMGALFWIWVITLIFRALSHSFSNLNSLTPLIAFAGFLLLWDVLFSPYGADRRFVTPFLIIIMMTCIQGFQIIRPQQRRTHIAQNS